MQARVAFYIRVYKIQSFALFRIFSLGPRYNNNNYINNKNIYGTTLPRYSELSGASNMPNPKSATGGCKHKGTTDGKGICKEFVFHKFEITMEVGGWVQVLPGFFLENLPKIALNQY